MADRADQRAGMLAGARTGRPAGWAAAIATAVVLTGCGSTVPGADRAGGSGSGSLATGSGGVDSTGGGIGGGGSARSDGSTAQGGAAGSLGHPAGNLGPGGATQAGRAGSAGGAGSSAPAHPVTGSGPIVIGFMYVKNAQQQVSAVGANNLVPDMHAGEQALIRDLNAHGGLNGHQVNPVFAPFDSASPTPTNEWAKICTTFTQDNKVFAAVVPGANDPSLSRCLSKAGVIEVSTLLTTEGQADFAEAPLLVEPASLNLDRLAQTEPRQLVAQHWLANRNDASVATDPKPRIGVVVFDKPAFREAYQQHLKPAYAALGAPVTDQAFIGDTADALSSQMPSVVLKFAQEGINHVTFLTSTGLAPGLFMLQATQQQYKPRYGFSSQDAIGVVIQDEPDPKGQLHQAVLVGWFPEADVADYTTPQNAQPGQASCLILMRKNNVQASDGNSAGIDDYMCDSVWYLRDALRSGGSAISTQSFLDGVNRLAGNYRPATTFATFLRSDRRDGAAQIRHASFAESCTCFNYTSIGIPTS